MIPDIDLTPPARRDSRRLTRRMTRWGVAAAVYAALMTAGVLTVRLGHAQGAQAEHSVIERARQRVDDLTAEAARTNQLAEAAARTVEAAERAGTHPDWSLLLRAITTARGDDAVLEAIDLKPLDPAAAQTAAPRAPAVTPAGNSAASARPGHSGDAYMLALRGVGVSHSAVLKFVARLEALGPLDTVEVVQTRRSATSLSAGAATDLSPAETWFELRCELLEERDPRPLTGVPGLPATPSLRATASAEDRP